MDQEDSLDDEDSRDSMIEDSFAMQFHNHSCTLYDSKRDLLFLVADSVGSIPLWFSFLDLGKYFRKTINTIHTIHTIYTIHTIHTIHTLHSIHTIYKTCIQPLYNNTIVEL